MIRNEVIVADHKRIITIALRIIYERIKKFIPISFNKKINCSKIVFFLSPYSLII